MRRALRLVVPLLLALGAAALAAVLVWPTSRLVTRSGGGSGTVADIWYWGRVRSAGDAVSASTAGSLPAQVLLGVAVLLALVAAAAWFAAARSEPVSRRGGALAGLLVAGAAVALLVAGSVGGSQGFGWFAYSTGSGDGSAAPEVQVESTPVSYLPGVALGLWAVAVIAILVVAARRRVPV